MLRATVVAALVTLVTAVAHAAGGGAFPPPLLLAAAAVWSVWCAFLVGGRRSTMLGTVASVALAQPAMHLAFSLGGHEIVHVGHHDAAAADLSVRAAGLLEASHDGTSMLVAHVLAGIVSIAVLRWGSAIADALVRVAATLLRRLLPSGVPATPAPRRAVRAAWSSEAPLVHPVERSLERRRGPPSLSLAR